MEQISAAQLDERILRHYAKWKSASAEAAGQREKRSQANTAVAARTSIHNRDTVLSKRSARRFTTKWPRVDRGSDS
jgi:hypothetical protein